MPFYIAPNGLECIDLEDMRLGLGELGVMRKGEVQALDLGETFAFFQFDGHAIGLAADEVESLITQLRRLQRDWAGAKADSATTSKLN